MADLSEITWMLRPLMICLVVTGILGYLGLHVLSRKVIFVDLAMAQIAALGATYAYLLGYDVRQPEDELLVYFFSLGFTLLGAAVFAITRMRHEKVPQEAFIGITYASASAIAILMLAKSTGEGEHLKQMLVGNVLLVTWSQIAKTASVFAVIGAFHWFFRRQFLSISLDAEAAAQQGLNIRLWDFLFYVSFGVVITSTVAIAGVLLVFSYLVVPAVIAVMFAETIGSRIFLDWIAGTLVSLAGMFLSYYGDLPTGPAVVACFAGLLLASGVAHGVMGARSKVVALAKIAAGVVLAAGLVQGSLALRKASGNHAHELTSNELIHALDSPEVSAQLEALDHLAQRKDPDAVPEILSLLKSTSSDHLIEHIATHVLPVFGDRSAVPVLEELCRRDYDAFLRVTLARAILDLKDPRGIPFLIEILASDEPLLARHQALEVLTQFTGKDFGYRVDGDPAENAGSIGKWQQWWREQGAHLEWRDVAGTFE